MTLELQPLRIKAEELIPQTNKNAMELLVNEEIAKQIESYPFEAQKYINQIEVATYALNRLPPLYASSEEGFYRQIQKGKTNLSYQISQVVAAALETIEANPLRFSTPLKDLKT